MTNSNGDSFRLLVVEDDYSNYAYIRAIFPPEIHIDWANCGKKALSCYSDVDYDLLLVDIGLPDFSGTDFIIHVRQNNPLIPIIVTTGFATAENKLSCHKAGANKIFFKPFYSMELRKCVYGYLLRLSDIKKPSRK